MTLLWISFAHAANTPVVDRVAAVVNDEVVALSDVYDLGGEFVEQRCGAVAGPCAAEAELEVLDALIRRALIRQELGRLDVDVTAADVDQAIDRTVQQHQLAGREALKREVEASGKRWDQYRNEVLELLRTQAFRGRVLAPRVTVTADEVIDLYARMARTVTDPGPLEEVEDQLEEQLFDHKLVEAEEEWYQRARREAAVKVFSNAD